MKDPNPFDPFCSLWHACEIGLASKNPLRDLDGRLESIGYQIRMIKAQDRLRDYKERCRARDSLDCLNADLTKP